MTIEKNGTKDEPAPTEKIEKRRAVIVRPRFRDASFGKQGESARHTAEHTAHARLRWKPRMTLRDDATIRHEGTGEREDDGQGERRIDPPQGLPPFARRRQRVVSGFHHLNF